LEDYVEVNNEGKVTVCRDFAKGKCSRVMCKYYHVPLLSPIAATANAVLPTAAAAAMLASSTSPFSSLLSSSSPSSPPWSLPSSLWFQRLQQQQQQAPLFNSNPNDYLNAGNLFSTFGSGSATNSSNFDQTAYLIQQQQQALLAAQQNALLNSTTISVHQKQQQQQIANNVSNNNRNGMNASTEDVSGLIGNTVAATTSSASNRECQTSPATTSGSIRPS
jgi:hypothetical protein